jgi:hypothetical protein
MSNRTKPAAAPAPDIAALLKRAAAHLMADDALSAQRTARTVEHLLALETRLQRRNQMEAKSQGDLAERECALAARQSELDARHVALNQREYDLACETQRLEELRDEIDRLYMLIYNAPGSNEPATDA